MERTDVGSDNGAEAQRRGDATAPLSPAPSSVALSAALNVSAAAPACVVDLAKRNLKQLHDLYRGIGEVRRAASRRGARGRRDCALDASQQHELAGKALATIARAQFLRDQRRSREARAEAAELEELVEVMAELNAELLESECIAQFGKHDDLDPDVMELTARIREIRSQKRAVENRRRALQREESDEEDAEQGMEEGAEEEGEEERVLVGGHPGDVAVLFLHGNALRTLAGVGIFRHLRKLDVADNMLRVLPHAAWWGEIPALEVLYLHDNQIESVEELAPLRALPKLTTLTLSRNPLASAPAYRARTIALLCEVTQLASLDARLVTEDERLEGLYDARFVPSAARARCRLARSPWAEFAAAARRGGDSVARAMAPQYRRSALASDHCAALLAETSHARSVFSPRASPAALLQRRVRVMLVAARWRRRAAAVCLLQLRCRAWLHRAQAERELRRLLAAVGMSELLVHPADRRIHNAVLKLQRSYRAYATTKLSTRVATAVQRIVRWWRWTTTMEAAAVRYNHASEKDELALCCHADNVATVARVLLRARHAASRWIGRAAAEGAAADAAAAAIVTASPTSTAPARPLSSPFGSGGGASTPFRPLSGRSRRRAGAPTRRTSTSGAQFPSILARRPMEPRPVPFVALNDPRNGAAARGIVVRARRRRARLGALVTRANLQRVVVGGVVGGAGRVKRRGASASRFDVDLFTRVASRSRETGSVERRRLLLAVPLPCATTVAIACRRLRYMGIPVILLRGANQISAAVAVQSMWRSHAVRQRIQPPLATRVRQMRAATLLTRLWRTQCFKRRAAFARSMTALARALAAPVTHSAAAVSASAASALWSDGGAAGAAEEDEDGATLYLEERVLALIVSNGRGALGRDAPGVALGSGAVTLVARTHRQWLRRIPCAVRAVLGVSPPRMLSHLDLTPRVSPRLAHVDGTAKLEYDAERHRYRNAAESAMVLRARRRMAERQRPLVRGARPQSSRESLRRVRGDTLARVDVDLTPLKRSARLATTADAESVLRLLTVGVVAHYTEVSWVELAMASGAAEAAAGVAADAAGGRGGARGSGSRNVLETAPSRATRTVRLLKLHFASAKEAKRRALALVALTWTSARHAAGYDALSSHPPLWAPLFTRAMLNDAIAWNVAESHRRWGGGRRSRAASSRGARLGSARPSSVNVGRVRPGSAQLSVRQQRVPREQQQRPLLTLPSLWALHRERAESASLGSSDGSVALSAQRRAALNHARGIVARWKASSAAANQRAKGSHDYRMRELQTRLMRNSEALRESQLKMRARWWRTLWEQNDAAMAVGALGREQAEGRAQPQTGGTAKPLDERSGAQPPAAAPTARWRRPQRTAAKPRIAKQAKSRRRRRSAGKAKGKRKAAVTATTPVSQQRIRARISSAQRYGGDSGY